jgi:hypothetical protein
LGFAVREYADVVVHFEELKIPPQFIGKNYDQDGEYRLQFQGWINQLWQQGCVAGADAPRISRQTLPHLIESI